MLRLRLRRRCYQVPRERGKAEHVVLLRGLRLVGVRVRVRVREDHGRLGGVDSLAARAAHMPGWVEVRLGAELRPGSRAEAWIIGLER